MRGDPTSFSNVNDAKTKQIDITWNVDFERKTLKGDVKLTIDILQDSVSSVVSIK